MFKTVRFYSTWLKQKQIAHRAQLEGCKLLEKRLPARADHLHGMVLDQFSNSLASMQSQILQAPSDLQPKLQKHIEKIVYDLDESVALQVSQGFETMQISPDLSGAITLGLAQQRVLIETLPLEEKTPLIKQLRTRCYESIQRIYAILASMD